MHTRLLLALGLGLAALTASAKDYRVFILSGQSNASGRAENATITAEPVDATIAYYYDYDPVPGSNANSLGQFRPLEKRNTRFGPEITLGRGLANAGVPNVALIKFSRGGTSLGGIWRKDSTSANKLYPTLLSEINKALGVLRAGGHSYTLEGFFWMQGESDTSSTHAPNYEANLTQFIADLRADLNAPGLPFFVGRICSFDQNGSLQGMQTVQAAQLAVDQAVPRVYSFSNDDFRTSGRLFDGVHYDDDAQIALGTRFAQAYLAATPDYRAFSAAEITRYGGSAQDGQNNTATSATPSPDGRALTLAGNAWKKVPLDYILTPDTRLEFTVQASDAGEILGLALEDDDLPTNAVRRAYRFGGSDIANLNHDAWSTRLSPAYLAGSGDVTYTLRPDQDIAGTRVVRWLGLIADDDANASTHATFSDLRLYEASSPLRFPAATAFTPHGPLQDGQNNLPSSLNVAPDGLSLTLAGNAWKKMPLSYTTTAETILEFTVTSTNPGEIIGLVLDNDDDPTNTPARALRFGGSDITTSSFNTWGARIYPTYFANSGPVTYFVRVADHLAPGSVVNHLAFFADDDVAGAANLTISNLRLYEP